MKDDFEKDFQSSESYYSTEESNNETIHEEGDFQTSYSTEQMNIPQDSPELHRTEITSMILGILAIVLSGCCCVNIVLAIISICFAAKTKKMTANGKISSAAVAGLVCSIISIAVFALYVLLVVLVMMLSILTTNAMVDFYYF